MQQYLPQSTLREFLQFRTAPPEPVLRNSAQIKNDMMQQIHNMRSGDMIMRDRTEA